MYTQNDQNEMSENEIRMREAEERIDNSLKEAGKGHDDISREYQFFLKRIENRLSDENLKAEDLKFFEEQRDMIVYMQRTEEDRYSEYNTILQKEKRDLAERYEEEIRNKNFDESAM